MNRIWLITKHHFMQEASKRSFLIVLFALPLFLAVTFGIGYMTVRLNEESLVIGYVDLSGVIREVPPAPTGDDVTLMAFVDEPAARAALDDGQIDAYYLLPPSFERTSQATLVFHDAPDYIGHRYFVATMRHNRVAGQPPAVVERLESGANITVRSLESQREFPANGPNAGHFLPLVIAFMLSFLIMTTSSYMAEVVVAEKANRTIEVLITSVSPGRMMVGKILGGILIALVQLTVWLGCLLAAVWLGLHVFEARWLQEAAPIWRDVGLLLLVAAPTYLLIASAITMIGSMMSDTYDSQQISGLSLLVLFLPIYALMFIGPNPNGGLAVALSLLPGTSLTTLAIRSLLTEVPTWQYLLSAGISIALALFTIWLAGKAFRVSMLRYGQRLRLSELFGRKGDETPQLKALPAN